MCIRDSINPAVSFAMWISKKLDTKDFVSYVIAQCLGAIVGAALLVFMFGSNASLGTNGYGALSALHLSLIHILCILAGRR